jgi:putative endonuclease
MSRNKITGNTGEQLAKLFLQQKQYRILETNWRFKHWEVDIIAACNNCLHFIEIKTRTSTRFGHPEESIHAKKMEALKNAAEAYQLLHQEWKRVQFDVLSIYLSAHDKTKAEYFFMEDIYF